MTSADNKRFKEIYRNGLVSIIGGRKHGLLAFYVRVSKRHQLQEIKVGKLVAVEKRSSGVRVLI